MLSIVCKSILSTNVKCRYKEMTKTLEATKWHIYGLATDRTASLLAI